MDSQPGPSRIRDSSPELSLRNVDSQPGPSRIRDSSPERPKKKYKIEIDDDVGSQSSSININDLPAEILIAIFKHLSVPDRLKAEKVCNKWYQLARSKVLWKCVKLSNVSESLFIEILGSLPPCVLHLECGSEKDMLVLPISLPELMAQLHEKCPLLNTLILSNMKLVKVKSSASYVVFTLPSEYDKHLFSFAKNKLEENASKIFESKFPKEEAIGLDDAVLPELKILSLRKVMFNASHFYSHISSTVLPNITALDLSYTQSPTSESSASNLGLPFSSLKELCLGAWWIAADDIFLKYLKKLKILDLECSILSYKAVSALKQSCTLLEELYLCRSNIVHIHRTSNWGDFFPCLRTLCVRETGISQKSIEELLTTCPLLKLVNVSCSKNITKTWYEGLCKDFKEKILLDSNKLGPCNHFLKKFASNGTT